MPNILGTRQKKCDKIRLLGIVKPSGWEEGKGDFKREIEIVKELSEST